MLDIRRLIRNLANLKNKETAKNKFLKTKPKIQEMKQNVEKAKEEADAIHDYVKRAVVVQRADQRVPLLEKESIVVGFNYIADQLDKVGETRNINGVVRTYQVQDAANDIRSFADNMELGIVVTNSGTRYLTTRARANQLGGTFTPITTSLANSLLGSTARIG